MAATKRAVYGAGSCEQVGPDRWMLRWSEGVDPFTGKHRRRTETITATTVRDARRELAARTSKRRRLSRVTFGELLDLTIPQLPIKPKTRETYTFVLKHIPEAARKWTAADISVVDGRVLFEGLTERCGAQTVRKIHGALMACWRQAHLNGWVDTNPWRGQRMPKVPTSAGRAMTIEEVAALRAACDQIERVWIDIHLATGARPGEVVGLRWSNIDLDDKVITFIDAKHDDTERPVAIDAELAERIKAWQNAQRIRAVAAANTGLADDPFLLSNDKTSAVPWRAAYAGSYRWPHLVTKAGIDADLRLYDCRHTHNSWLEADGFDATTRAARLGNSPATNQRVYSHPLRDREAADAIAARLR